MTRYNNSLTKRYIFLFFARFQFQGCHYAVLKSVSNSHGKPALIIV